MKFWKLGKIRNLLVVAVFAFLAFQVTTFAGSLGLTNFDTGTGTYSVQISDHQGNISINLGTNDSGYVRTHSFYAHLTNENFLEGLVVASTVSLNASNVIGVNASNIDANNVFGVGNSSVSGGGASDPGPFDIGIEFEAPNPSTNSNNEVSFTLTDANSNPLSVDDLAADQPIGIVFEHVGNEDDGSEINQIVEVFTSLPSDEAEEDNLIVFVTETLPDGGGNGGPEIINVVNPEPTTVLLLGIGLTGMAGVSLRRMRKTAQRKKLNQ